MLIVNAIVHCSYILLPEIKSLGIFFDPNNDIRTKEPIKLVAPPPLSAKYGSINNEELCFPVAFLTHAVSLGQ